MLTDLANRLTLHVFLTYHACGFVIAHINYAAKETMHKSSRHVVDTALHRGPVTEISNLIDI
jgi:hypothetical protein